MWVDFKELKEKIGIEKILEHYGLIEGLKRKGDRIEGHCPIHKGKGFSASLEKNAWYCFGCNKGGNILDLVSAIENVDIREAASLISKWFKIGSEASQNRSQTLKNRQESQKNDSGVSEQSENQPKEAKIEEFEFNQPLTFELKTLEPNHPYLRKRGLKEETIRNFGLGYCKKSTIIANRIAIPIYDFNPFNPITKESHLVAYAGRLIDDKEISDENPKYKLPPNFKKSWVIFNLHRAVEQLEENPLILVEGFFDCFKVWQAGYHSVVALMGSQMSEAQEKLIIETLGKGSSKIILFFDGDEAGYKCTEEVVKKLIEKVYVKVITLNKGLQPDQLKEEEIKKLLG